MKASSLNNCRIIGKDDDENFFLFLGLKACTRI